MDDATEELDLPKAPPKKGEGDGSADEASWVAASSGVFAHASLERIEPAEGDGSRSADPAARARRRRRMRALYGAVALACLVAGGFGVYAYRRTASRTYERYLLATTCESPGDDSLRRVLACIELCDRRSARHCAMKGDLYAASRDAAGAARAYREACQLGEPRACALVDPRR